MIYLTNKFMQTPVPGHWATGQLQSVMLEEKDFKDNLTAAVDSLRDKRVHVLMVPQIYMEVFLHSKYLPIIKSCLAQDAIVLTYNKYIL